MNRTLTLLLLSVAAMLLWLALRLTWSGPVPVAETLSTSQTRAPSAIESAAPVAEQVEQVARTAAQPEELSTGAQPPIPEDAIWLDVRVVDAQTQQPIAGSEVRWTTSDVWQQTVALPERERQEFHATHERTALRFGWLTHTDGEGTARIAGNRNGANVHARSEGRYGFAYIGDESEVPKEGWVVELERDLTLRARVLDALGRPAVGAFVGIRMFDAEGRAIRNHGWVRAEQAKPPDALVEFRHVQRWLRGTSRKRDFEVGHWRVAPEVPGVDGPSVKFDVDAPPAEPIELRLPATGRITARLLHERQPYTKGVVFQVYRGEENDNDQGNYAPRIPVDDDGWARFPLVALGGSVVVVARSGPAEVTKTVAAPLGQDQEVRVELSTEELFALRGQFVGPDGAWLANATVQANYNMEVTWGGGTVETDAQGRFLWLLTKGHKDSAQMKSLVFSQQFADRTPARTLTVTPREIHRGVNDLGVLQLSNGALVVAGQLQFDMPHHGSRRWFEVEALSDRHRHNGEERWERATDLTTSVREDGSFDVRGATKPVRHRLVFPGGDHLPITPVEFRVGTTDLVIPIHFGHYVEAKVLLDDNVPADLLRGTLRPGFTPPAEYEDKDRMSWRGDRYQAAGWCAQAAEATLQWQALPAGTYTLEVGAVGVRTPIVRIENVVLPLPEGGDDRLVEIDLRGKLQILEVRVTRPKGEDGAELRSGEALVFPMPQADEQHWQGLQVYEGQLSMPVAPGPLELMVVGVCQPQRVHLTAEQVATGKLIIELRAWPRVELLFANVPTLPEGMVLRALSYPVAATGDQRRYTTQSTIGSLDTFLRFRGDSAEVVDGRAAVTVSDGVCHLGAYLVAKEGGRHESLRSVTPSEIQGGENLAPITVQLSTDEITAAIEKLTKDDK